MKYVVMHAYYSDWEIYGYFTTRKEAEKYVVAHSDDDDLHIEEVKCLDNTEDLSWVKVRYAKPIIFRKKGKAWECEDNGDPTLYKSEFPRSNRVESEWIDAWIRVVVNTTENDLSLQMKIAQDIFYQFLSFCEGEPTDEDIYEFNKVLSREEDMRDEARKLEEIRRYELAELERLKAKYERGGKLCG